MFGLFKKQPSVSPSAAKMQALWNDPEWQAREAELQAKRDAAALTLTHEPEPQVFIQASAPKYITSAPLTEATGVEYNEMDLEPEIEPADDMDEFECDMSGELDEFDTEAEEPVDHFAANMAYTASLLLEGDQMFSKPRPSGLRGAIKSFFDPNAFKFMGD